MGVRRDQRNPERRSLPRAAHGTLAATGETMAFVAVPDGVRPAEPQDAAPQSARALVSHSTATAARKRHAGAGSWQRCQTSQRELEFVPTADFAPFDEVGVGCSTPSARSSLPWSTAMWAPVVATTVRGYSWCIAIGEFYAVRFAKTGNDDGRRPGRRFQGREHRGLPRRTSLPAPRRTPAVMRARTSVVGRPTFKPSLRPVKSPSELAQEPDRVPQGARDSAFQPGLDGVREGRLRHAAGPRRAPVVPRNERRQVGATWRGLDRGVRKRGSRRR